MAGTTTKGLRYPSSGDNNNVPTDMQNLASDVDGAMGAMTQSEINALTAGQKWTGRRVYNSTTARWQVYNGTSWLNEGGIDYTGACLRLRRAASASISNGSNGSEITWDTEDADPEAWITVSSKYPTVPTGLGGLYAFHVKVVGSNGPIRRGGYMNISPVSTPGTVQRQVNAPYDDDWWGENTVYFSYMEFLQAGQSASFAIKNNAGYTVNYTATLQVYRLTMGAIP